ncbi:hypothetical protein FB451DRAFT_440150 [Mycena latifolia]|nr:hypothetical protein FB451DRAFT_440150 [Mycena latifolia]
MSVRRVKNWVKDKLHPEGGPSRPSSPQPPNPVSSSPQSQLPSAGNPPSASAKSTSKGDTAIDNVALALNLAQQVGNIVQKVPFIAPTAALMLELVKVYKEVKDTNEKRDVVLANITGLTHDLCGTILRMEATNHLDLIGRLKADLETYTGLLTKASVFIKEYDGQGAVIHVAARNEIGDKFNTLNRELDSFGARFRTNCLVDLAINQNTNTQILDKVHDMVLEEKLEKWLQSPSMKQKQLDTQNLRKEGTGLWLLDGDKFIEWQDHPGSLWIQGQSGAGKSVLSSGVISKLTDDAKLFTARENAPLPPALAFFYFDFKDKQAQAVDIALRRILLQLSAQSPHAYRALEEQYTLKSKGQTLPNFQDLLVVLEKLLLELGHSYIILDALDECPDNEHQCLVDLISTLQKWTQSYKLHLLITSQPRQIFTDGFAGVACIELDTDTTQEDIKLFVLSSLKGVWANHADHITDRVVQKSNGMFRLAACLVTELTSSPWPDDLDETLKSLPDTLFGIYNRFLEKILPKHWVYVEQVLRWLLFSVEGLHLDVLADAIAFDFSNPAQYIYKPSRCTVNKVTIPKWLKGLVTFNGWDYATLAHASVKDYLLSKQFTAKFGCDLSASISHTVLAKTCIDYLLNSSNHNLNHDELQNHPLARYAAKNWCHHLLHSHDRTILFAGAMQLLEDGSSKYENMMRVFQASSMEAPASSLHLCCERGYLEGLHAILENGVDVNALSEKTGVSVLHQACRNGHTAIVHVLLENGADVNAEGGKYCSALQAACSKGHTVIVHALLENSADVNAGGGKYGSALQAACRNGGTDIVQILLKNGADVNAGVGEYGSALQAASARVNTEIVCILIKHSADVNAEGGKYGSALQAASSKGQTGIVQILLENGADVNAVGGEYGSALQAARTSNWSSKEIVDLLLENGAIDTAAAAV